MTTINPSPRNIPASAPRQITHYASSDSVFELCTVGEDVQLFLRSPSGKVEPISEPYTYNRTAFVPFRGNFVTTGPLVLPPPPHSSPQDSRALFLDVQAFMDTYVAWTREFSVCATAFVMATYIYTRFAFFGCLQFSGPIGSGKTRSLDVLKSLCYHALRFSKPTPASIFRSIASYSPTLLIDEIDGRFRRELADVLREGSSRSGCVIRCSSDTFEPVAYPCYGPKVFAGQEPFEDAALLTRIISEQMELRRAGPRITPTLPSSFEANARELRSRLIRWGMDNYHAIPERDPQIGTLRQRQVLIPFFTVTPPEFDEQLVAVQQRQNRSERAAIRETFDGKVVAAICQIGADRFRPSEIADRLNLDSGIEDTRNPEFVSPAKVGRSIRRVAPSAGLKTTSSGQVYSIDPEELRLLAEQYAVGQSEHESGGSV